MMTNRSRTSGYQKLLAAALLLLLWQLAAAFLDQKLLLCSPLEVAGRLLNIWKEPGFLSVIWFSFRRIAGGYLLAFSIGILLAVLAGRFHWLEVFLQPVMSTIKSVPVASFIIIALVWLSSGKLSRFISFLMVLPVIYSNVSAGIRSIDRKMLEMADLFRLSFRKRFVYIWLPEIRPYLFSACSIALGMAWKSGIAAEVIGIPSGSIGEKLYEAKAYLNTVDLFSWTVIIVTVSIAFEKLNMLFLKRFYQWLEDR